MSTQHGLEKVSRREFLGTTAGATAAGLVLSFRPEALFSAAAAASGSAPVFAPSVFVEIGSDNAIRLIVQRSEMGQGARTSMAMLLAEELEVSLGQVEIVQADGDKKYGDQNTDGSRSVRQNFVPLRQAGAAAREMLVGAAAARWGVAAGECRAQDGAVHHQASGKKLAYGEVAADAAKLEVPKEPKLKPESEWKLVGKPLGLVDVPDIVQGKATYGIDVVLPGMLFAMVERSPTVAGKVKSFDPAPALAVRGVKKVMQLEPIPAQLKTFGGVAVVADNTWAASEGRDALAIEWDRGTASENSEQFRSQLETLVSGDGKVFRKEGDYAAAKGSASKVISAVYHGPHLAHAPMEPLAAVALVKDGTCEVWAPIQDPQGARQRVAAVVGLPEDKVAIHVTLLGGGFGRKSKPDFILEAVQVAKAMEGTPIKMTWKREDEIRHGYYRGQNCQKVEATLDAEKQVTGWRHHTAFPTIASTFAPGAKDPAGFELGMGLHNLPYRIPNIQLEASGIVSDLRIGWLRSVCNTFHAHAINCFTDELAEAAGKDPVKYRLELLGEPRKLDFSGHDKPHGFETGRLSKVIEAAAEMSEWGKALPQGMGHGFAAHFSFLTYVAMAMKASVEEGQIRVHEVHCAFDCGAYVNPDTVKAQIEGAVVFGLSYALYGEITVDGGSVKQSNFHDYPLLRIDEMPVVHVKLFPAGANPPAGVGEPGVPPVSAALANALYKATGKRYRDLPLQKQFKAWPGSR